MTIQAMASGRKDLIMIDPRIIQEKVGWNMRHEGPELTAHIRMLADSIKEIGVQNPLTIYKEGNEIFVADGFCRRAASLLAIAEGAELKAVPCLVAPKGTSEAHMVADMLTRNSGRPPTSLEIADIASRLMGFGWTLEAIAKRAGRTVGWINELLELRAAPKVVTDAVKGGHVSATLAADLVSREGGQKAAQIITETQERTGKERVTKKDLPKPVTKSKPFEPMSITLLRGICEADENGAGIALDCAINEAREYLATNP